MAGLIGRTFGDYQLTEQIGASGVAEVYRARPQTVRPGSREAVVKVIHPEFARQPGFIPNFRRIVEMSKKLAAHPHVLPLIASGEESSYLYLVSPYVADGTLQGWLQRGGRLGVGDTGPFFRQLCSALGYAHSLGVTHDNLKPSNIYLFEGRHVLLGDFGLLWDVRQLDMNHRGSGTEAIEYMAPEIFGGQSTPLSDIYSLGAVLFATLVGQAPFHGGEKPADVYNAHLTKPTPSLAIVAPGLAPPLLALDPVIQKAMAKRPTDRIASAALVAQSIEMALQAHSAQQPPAPGAPFQQPMAVAYGAPQPGVFGAGAAPAPASGPPIPPVFSAQQAPMAAPGAMNPLPSPMAAVPGGLAGGAAAAVGASPAAAAALTRLNFPPLPPTAQVEEQMESGRPGVQSIQPSKSYPGAPVSQPHPPQAAPANAANAANASQTHNVAAPSAFNDAASASFPSTERPVTSRVPAPQAPDFPTARVPAPNANVAGKRGGMGFDSAAVDAAFDATFGGAFTPLDDPSASGAQSFAPRGPTFTTPTNRGRDLTAESFPELPVIRGGRNERDDDDRWSESVADRRNGEDLWQREWLDGEEPAIHERGGQSMRRDTWQDQRARQDWSGEPDSQEVAAPRRSGWNAETGWGIQDSGDLAADAQQAYPQEQGSYNRYDANGWTGEMGNASEMSRPWNEAFTGEYTGYADARQPYQPYPQDSQEYNAYQASQEYPAEHAPGFFPPPDAPFSATDLGLPRLTHPVLGDMPVSWQELTSGDDGAPRGRRRDGYLDDDFSQEQAALALSWPGQSAGGREPNSAQRGANARMSNPSRRNAPPILTLHNGPDDDVFGNWENPGGNRPDGSGARGGAATATKDDFARQPGWTDSDKALKRKRRRWAPIILVTVILLTLIELLTLPVIRPDICGSSACVAIRSAAHRVFPSLGGAAASAHVVVTSSPSPIQVGVGQSASTQLGVANTGVGAAQWQASASATWLTVAPNAGTLAAGATVLLTLTAKPVNIAAGSYALSVTLLVNGASLVEPVKVSVTQAPTLTVSPQTLTFTAGVCGPTMAQTLTLQNTGGASLTVTITPSSQLVLLNGANQPLSLTIAAGASQNVKVAISCQSTYPQTYTLALSGNGGNPTVTVQYG